MGISVAQAFAKIQENGVIAIMRANSSDQLLAAADAVKAGGVNAIEVTMTTPNALEIIHQATTRYGDDVLFGVGSVLDPETARAAILAGAQFVVCPILNLKIIEICHRYSILVAPGAYTPTEIITAWEAGADAVKVFPASVGGPAFIKSIKDPLPQVKLVPVGGVNLDNTADFIRAGAEFVGVGGSLVNQKLLEGNEFDKITENAKRYCQEVELGRNSY